MARIARRVRCIRSAPHMGQSVGGGRSSVAFESADQHDYGVVVQFDVLAELDGENEFVVGEEYTMTLAPAGEPAANLPTTKTALSELGKDRLEETAAAMGLEVEGSGADGNVVLQDLVDAIHAAVNS